MSSKQSHPSQGAGVEIVQCPRCRNYFLGSHPTWGAGVEIASTAAQAEAASSRAPRGVRELESKCPITEQS